MPSIDSAKKYFNRYSVFFLLAIIIGHGNMLAQGSGTIKGQVRDAENGTPLPGASVMIQGSSLGAAADLDGEFSIYNAPAENITLKISYLGYVTLMKEVTVIDGEQLKIDINLTPQTLEGEAVVVTAQAQGQMQAINQQLSSNRIVNVVSEAKIQELPDFNAAEAIGRLPGISVLRSSGEANKIVIRGIAPQYNLVAVEGINLSATGGGTGVVFNPTDRYSVNATQDRSTDITMISPTMLKSIEVNKTFTPDMDAGAIGGFVNMKLREAPSEFHSNVMWQSGYVRKTKEYGNYKALADVSNRFFDDILGIYLLGNAEQYDRGDDRFNSSYSKKSIDPRTVYNPVIAQNAGLNRHFETRSRYGANLIVDFTLPSGSIKLINMVSRLKSNSNDYTTRFDLFPGGSKNLTINLSKGDGNTDVMTNALQSEYELGWIAIDLGIANSYSQNYTPHQRTYTFTHEGALAGILVNDNTIVEHIIPQASYVDSSTLLQFIGDGSYRFKENGQTYSSNLKVPFNLESSFSGFLKFGGKYRYTKRVNDQNLPYAQLFYGGSQGLIDAIATRFPGLPMRDTHHSATGFSASGFANPDQSIARDFLNNKFGDLRWVPTSNVLDQIMDFVNSRPDFITPDLNNYISGPYQNLVNDYSFIEQYYAAYGMVELDLGSDIMIVGGARYEDVTSDFTAYRILDQGNPRNQPSKVVTVHPGNHYLLPMVQAKYNIVSWADIRYAYTKTLARPDFTATSPYQNADTRHTNIFAGNPDLVPAESYNHDVMVSFHDNDLGLFTIGGFYKTIRNFVYSTSYNLWVDSLTLPGFFKHISDFSDVNAASGNQINTWVNNPNKATLKGLEADWQTRFWYLPFPFDGMVFSVNYTHVWSDTKYPYIFTESRLVNPNNPRAGTYLINIDTSRTGRLLNQSADILNTSIGYDYEGFSSRISFFYQADMVSGISSVPETDSFTDPYFKIDISVKQKLPLPGMQLFLNVNNVNEREDISTQRSIGGITQQNFYGLTADLGLRYSF